MSTHVLSIPDAPSTQVRPGTDDTIRCFDPATLEELGQVPVMHREEVLSRVERARKAQVAWGRTSFAQRRAVLRGLQNEILANQEEICRIAVRDSGKTMVDAIMGEVVPVCEKIRYTIARGEKDLSPQPRSAGILAHKKAHVEYHPLGVIGVIAPWNFPFHNLFCPVIPALFAGNAVLAKVSEWTSWSAAPYEAIFHRVLRAHGHSPDLLQVLTGYGETGEALVTSGVEKIFFTGSPQNGRKVMRAASETLTPVVLELGGKDPMIVCDDADVEHAARQAMLGVFTASGQMCVAMERFYVHDAVYDEFVRNAVAKVRALRQGPPLDEQHPVDIGAMTMPRQLDIIEELVADAVSRGARVLAGGKRNTAHAGQFFEPTVLVDVDDSMRITREEQFGPVMVIMRVSGEEEAIERVNACPYGLGAAVFTRDAKRALRIQARIRAGMTVVNEYGIAYVIQSLPFGGTKISGFGRINGREGLRACCNTKAVVQDRFPFSQGVFVYPVQPTTFAVGEAATRFLFAGTWGARARAAFDTVRSLVTEVRARMARRAPWSSRSGSSAPSRRVSR